MERKHILEDLHCADYSQFIEVSENVQLTDPKAIQDAAIGGNCRREY